MTTNTSFATMSKAELRAACKAAGIAYGKLNNDGMRAALEAAQPKPSRTKQVDRHSGTGLKIEKNREEKNGITRPSIGGKCRQVWDALDTYRTTTKTLPTVATAKELATKQGWNVSNAAIEFYRWKKFNGLGK